MWIYDYSSAGSKEIDCQVTNSWNWDKLTDSARKDYLTEATTPKTGLSTRLVFFDQPEIRQLFLWGYFDRQPQLSLLDLTSISRVETVCVRQKPNIGSQPVDLIIFHGYTQDDNSNPVILGRYPAAQLRQTVERLWIKTPASALF